MCNFKVGFIGAGNMAGAIIEAILSSDILAGDQLFFFDTNKEKKTLYQNMGIKYCTSDVDLVKTCDIVFLAVKPQVMDFVLENIKSEVDGKVFVSIAAGISVAHINDVLGESCSVIRVLPNTPMLVRRGATVIARPDGVDQRIVDFVVSVFEATGKVEFLDEELINAVIPVSSSSPAFFFRMIDAMANAGAVNGIDYDIALALSIATMHGATHLLSETGKTPKELIDQVSSPGGTTVAALSAFDELGYDALIDEAFVRCINRAEELGKSK